MSLPFTDYSENALVEQPAIALFGELWGNANTVNCLHESFGPGGTLGREADSEVVLVSRLRPALMRLNPGVPAGTIDAAVEELVRDRTSMGLVNANRDIYKLLKDGVRVEARNQWGEPTVDTVCVIDWDNPDNNDFLLVSQLWVTGDIYTRRPDLVGFVNGLPLVVFELKAVHKRLEDAYSGNIRDYKTSIPQLFWYNGFIIVSNGADSRIGTITSSWEHFSEWKKVDSEDEQGITSLETIIRGTCGKSRLLDLIENYVLFVEAGGGTIKVLAMNHQYLGVENAIRAFQGIKENQGKLGVFWHTQGSGKSYSMIFFSQKILRKHPGNWTFAVVTDRQELDEQIYKNFVNAGAVIEQDVQATSGEHLKRLLRENHRNVFTLIHKFHTEKGERYPKLSDRSDIIVMVDEAHRTQYDILAMNMRNALPNAAFIAFTGTPLMAGEERTREVFGDYVSVYNFAQSVEDSATVPLYYENRIPRLQLTNEALNDDLNELLDSAALDEEQEKKLEREFARQYHLITRDDRLEAIAEDIVAHFMGRGDMGKAMVVSVDKATAVRMYDKVGKYWRQYLDELRAEYRRSSGQKRDTLAERVKFMEETDMAVVVSSAQNEVEDFAAKGLDILTHRKRMINEQLDTKFKNPDDPLRIVFVCAMWITGFDVPCLSTIYLDKPMKNHTLMQTIARANRVFKDKTNGLIVDYIGIFRDLQRALAIYGTAQGGAAGEGDMPIKDKDELVTALGTALDEAEEYCRRFNVDPAVILASQGGECAALIADAADSLLETEESKKEYTSLASDAIKLYKAILPDPRASGFQARVTLLAVLVARIRALTPLADISQVMEGVNALLDDSIATDGYRISDPVSVVDLSQVDFEALRKKFDAGRKRTIAEQLKGAINTKLQKMVRLNKSRTDFADKFQKLIDDYNAACIAGNPDIDDFFGKLVKFTKELDAEERRGIAEQLSEEELAMFDILAKPDINLDEKEKNQVKQVARDLLETLKTGKLVLDWRKRQQSRAQVRQAIDIKLDAGLPRCYTKEIYKQKCDDVFRHVYDSYYGAGQSIYSQAG